MVARTEICEMSDIASFIGVVFQGQKSSWRFLKGDENSKFGQDVSLGVLLEAPRASYGRSGPYWGVFRFRLWCR